MMLLFFFGGGGGGVVFVFVLFCFVLFCHTAHLVMELGPLFKATFLGVSNYGK